MFLRQTTIPRLVLVAAMASLASSEARAGSPEPSTAADADDVAVELVVEWPSAPERARQLIEDGIVESLTRHSYVVREGGEKKLVVSIVSGDQPTDFRIDLQYRTSPDGAMQSMPTVECLGCGGVTLQRKINEAAIEVMSKHSYEPPPPVAEAPPPEPVAPTSEPAKPNRPSRGLAMLGTGIGLASIGGGAALGIAVGIGVRYRDDQPPDTGRWASLGIATAGALASIPLIIIGHKRYRENRPDTLAASASGRSTDRPTKGLFYGGIGMLSAGTAALGTGISFMFIDKYNNTRFPRKRREFWPTGLGLAAGGGLLVAGGLTSFIIDRYRARRDGFVVVPVVDRQHAGVMVTSRF